MPLHPRGRSGKCCRRARVLRWGVPFGWISRRRRSGVGTAESGPDVIVYEGIRYQIRHVRDWSPHGFIEALGIREDGQSD